jgi:hypothetical protein
MADHDNPNRVFGEGTYGFEGKFCSLENGSVGIFLEKDRVLLLKEHNEYGPDKLVCKLIWPGCKEWSEPYKESVPYSMFDDGWDNLNESVICGDINKLITDGIKYRKLKHLLKDDK